MGKKIKQPARTTMTPRDLMGAKLFDELEKILRKHLEYIGDPPKPGEYPCLVFGQMPGGSVTKIKFPGEFQ